MSDAKVTGLWIYPVKSCRGIALTEMHIGPTGPVNDRRWMIVDEQNQFLTRRTEPKLAQIKTSLQGPFLHLYLAANKILINHTSECENVETVTVWKDTFRAGIETHDINEAISDFLGRSVKLARYQSQSFRDIHAGATKAVKETMFADARPLLLTNENSLNDLSHRLSEPSRMDRFRANLIVAGIPAYAEDKIVRGQIGEVKFENPKLCGRCPVITQDMETGEVVSKETLTKLAEYRKEGSRVLFGIYLTPASTGDIRVGDLLTFET